LTHINRRDFIKLSGKYAALLGLAPSGIAKVAEALTLIQTGTAPVLWLQGQSCSGCSVSLLNSENPSPATLLTQYLSLKFHSTLSASSGKLSMDTILQTIDAGSYILVIEGSIPAKMPEACKIGEHYFTDLVKKAAGHANAVIAVGTCAAFGGIPAAENNPTGSQSTGDFFKASNINVPLINIPGCPSHPDWITGTIVHVLKFGIPKLDALNRPTMFFSKLIHDQCPRFADYEREKFAMSFSEKGCLFKLGCQGPITHADCTTRLWNGGINSCIQAEAPCVGCASEFFAKKASYSFYRRPKEEN